MPILAPGTGDAVFDKYANDADRQMAVFVLACHHGNGAVAMRAGIRRSDTDAIKAAILDDNLPTAPVEIAQALLAECEGDVDRAEVAMLFRCNQGNLADVVGGLLRHASVDAAAMLIRDLPGHLPPWSADAEATIMEALSGSGGSGGGGGGGGSGGGGGGGGDGGDRVEGNGAGGLDVLFFDIEEIEEDVGGDHQEQPSSLVKSNGFVPHDRSSRLSDRDRGASVAFLLAHHYDMHAALSMYLGADRFDAATGDPVAAGELACCCWWWWWTC
jgi:hypothetical protein